MIIVVGSSLEFIQTWMPQNSHCTLRICPWPLYQPIWRIFHHCKLLYYIIWTHWQKSFYSVVRNKNHLQFIINFVKSTALWIRMVAHFSFRILTCLFSQSMGVTLSKMMPSKGILFYNENVTTLCATCIITVFAKEGVGNNIGSNTLERWFKLGIMLFF